MSGLGDVVTLGANVFAIHSPKNVAWEPQEDITTLELALCIPVFSMGSYDPASYIVTLPESAQRHFKITG